VELVQMQKSFQKIFIVALILLGQSSYRFLLKDNF